MPDSERYSRQVLLPGIGARGQERLRGSGVVIVGCGALGCVSADLLVRAGVGHVRLIDRDLVELSNLQRQPLFDERDAAKALPKAEAARRRLASVNGSILIEGVVADVSADDAERLLGLGSAGPRPDAIVDGTDNFETRFLLNDAAVKHGVPLIYGGAIATRGMVLPILPGRTPCLRCVFDGVPEPGSQPTCETAGVLGPVTAIVGAWQAAEAIKLLAGHEDRVSRSLLEFDVWEGSTRRLDLGAARRGDCPCCGQRRFEHLERTGDGAARLCGRSAVQVRPHGAASLDLGALARRLGPQGEFVETPYFVRGTVREPIGGTKVELTIFPDGRAIVRGTERADVARSVYARLIGS